MAAFKLFAVLALSLITLTIFAQAQLPEGYGCREGDLPNAIRRDCHPEAGANEQECHKRGCVWCEHGGITDGFPACFYRDTVYEPLGPTCDAGYVPPESREDCSTGDEPINEMECRYRNCTWCPSLPDAGIPWCFKSNAIDNTGYRVVAQMSTPEMVRLELVKSIISPMWDNEATSLIADFHLESNERLRIKITDGKPRYEVPLEIGAPSVPNDNLLYEIRIIENPFSFQIVRKSSGAVLFDSNAGKFTFSDQFISMSWKLPTENVYGIGENEQRSLKHDFSEKLKYPMWAADQPPYFTTALYGTQPQYTVVESNGNTHAVAIVNSNSQEWQMLPGPSIKYITIGGIIDMYVFLGPTPQDTVRQYTEAVGRSQMPPYWGLGFQLCKYGYNSLDEMKAAVDRTAFFEIPHDVQYGDIDIMDRELDFTYNTVEFAGLPQYIMELKQRGIKFVTILDPFISIIEDNYRAFELGQEMDVWVKKADGSPVTGRVWPRAQTAPVYFPDYSKPNASIWWRTLITEFHDLLAFDGLWIDMNEPANFENGDLYEGCAPNNYNYPPYNPGDSSQRLFEKTICPDHVDSVSIHYNTHSLYGWFESKPTLEGTREATGKRGMVLSRSTFLGSGRWTNHWLGDNWSHWSNLHFSIIGVIQFNLWGIPYVGPDICGFIGNSNAALCQRWQELGAFYPFSRNHNGLGNINQDPGAWGANVAASTKTALEVRYTLLPYLYTLFYHHVMDGSAVFRPLWYNYPTDPATLDIDRQFMWGTGILVTPVLEEAFTTVTGYFPDQKHYSFYDGSTMDVTKGEATLTAPLDFIPVHIVGGNIIPIQDPARNTELARENPMGLIVALDATYSASGALFYDDGESIETHLSGDYFYATFEMRQGVLSSKVVMDGYPQMGSKVINKMRLLGAIPISTITVNGVPHTAFTTTPTGEVRITELNLTPNVEFEIVFN